MQRLTRRSELAGDDGSSVILVSVIMVMAMLMGAVVVDVAIIFSERRVLQNGADAGALAIAEQCGTGDCGDPVANADEYANANSEDAVSTVDEVCGTGVDGVSDCADPPTLPAGANYVRVTTVTEETDGSDKVPFGFAHLLGVDGQSVRAESTVAWGGPSSLVSALPMTISLCEYNAYTSDGTVLQDPPPYDLMGHPSPEAVIYLHDTTGASPCDAGPSGADLPGGFGWLATDDDCNAVSNIDDWFDDKTGRPPPTSCTAELMAALVGTVVALPIFDQTNGLTGTNGEYHMSGYAAFYVTGYSILGQFKVPSLATLSLPCNGQASCVSGFFVNAPAPVSGSIGGPSMGVTVVALIE